MYTLVDDSLFDELSKYSWYAKYDPNLNGYYAATSIKDYRTLSMHRYILKLKKGDKRKGDHINGNTLDNRMCNLRITDSSGNNRNRKLQKNNTSGFIGVTKPISSSSWRAQIKFNGKMLHLGCFARKEDAALCYQEKAKELFGEFLRTE